MITSFKSHSHARRTINVNLQTGALFKRAIQIHGEILGYVESLRILFAEIQLAREFMGPSLRLGSSPEGS